MIYICMDIFFGKNRVDMLEEHNITEHTLKSHLKSIYRKTIEKDLEAASNKRSKMVDLVLFLRNLEKST